MYQLLVPVDRNEERADAQVGAIVDAPYDTDELTARVLHVVEDVDTPFSGAGPDYADALEAAVEEVEGLPDTVGRVAGSLREAGIETTVHTTRGVPTDAILEIVEAGGVDGVAIGCRRRTPVGKVVFGSVAQEVIRRADCPVLVSSR